jgi:hypothetical protein
MFCFGLVMTLQGLVTNFSGLVATRFFLGLCEAGAFPVSLSWQFTSLTLSGMFLPFVNVV